MVLLYKNKCEKLEEQTRCNRSGLINYMRTNAEKIAYLEEKIAHQDTELKKYKEALEKMRPAIKICMNECNSLMMPESIANLGSDKLSHSTL